MAYHGKIQLLLFCDIGTFDEVLAKEWLSCVAQATEAFLGEESDLEERGDQMARL